MEGDLSHTTLEIERTAYAQRWSLHCQVDLSDKLLEAYPGLAKEGGQVLGVRLKWVLSRPVSGAVVVYRREDLF